MYIFNQVPYFKLEVYHPQIGNYIKCPSLVIGGDTFYRGQGFIGLLEMGSFPQQRIFGEVISRGIDLDSTLKQLKYCIKKKYINKEWIRCAEWYIIHRRQIRRVYSIFQKMFPSPLLYRSIDPKLIPLLLEMGSVTAVFKEEYEDQYFKALGLTRSKYIWAEDFIEKAWEYATRNNPSVIAVYKKRFFYHQNVPNNRRGVWVKRSDQIKYSDTLEAVIEVKYLY
jgi:hypothetical protein